MPGHYLNQCWVIEKWKHDNKHNTSLFNSRHRVNNTGSTSTNVDRIRLIIFNNMALYTPIQADLNNAKPMLQIHIHYVIFTYIEGKLARKALLVHCNCCSLLLLDTVSVINSIFNYSRAEQIPAAALGGQWVSAWPIYWANVKAEIWRSTFVTLLKTSANKCIP